MVLGLLAKGGSRKTLKRVGKLFTLKNYVMKKIKLLGVIGALLLLTSQTVLSQANRRLSNLQAPTAVNKSLLPDFSCTRNLGSNSFRWKNLYLCNKEGINIDPLYPLDIYNNTYGRAISINNDFSSPSDLIGVYSESIIADGYGFGILTYGGWRGVYAEADAGAYTGTGIGVYALAFGTAGSRYGIYASASGGATNYAGYFDGDINVTGTVFFASDRKFKNNISPVKGSLEQLMKLKPSVYDFKTAEYSDMGLPKGKQMGLIADEVKAVFPGLVKEAAQPAKYGKDKTVLLHPEVRYEAVNYVGLIPVMIAAMQEQQKTIEAVKAENLELKSRLDKIEQTLALNSGQSSSAAITLTDARLEQNAPNPFNQRTVINYFVPQQSAAAVLRITDMNGRIMKTVTLSGKGKGQLVLDANLLSPGTYQYSLLLNGKIIDTRQMIITK